MAAGLDNRVTTQNRKPYISKHGVLAGFTPSNQNLARKCATVTNVLYDDICMELESLIHSNNQCVNNVISSARYTVVREIKKQRQMEKTQKLGQGHRVG